MEKKYWSMVSPHMGTNVGNVARQCEERGFYGVLAGQNWGPPWIPLAAAASATKSLQLGSSIAIAGTRSPVETAMAALDMDRISGGRFVLGLGASTHWNTHEICGEPLRKPLAHLRETVAAVRHIMRGAHKKLEPFHGQYYRSDFPEFQPIPEPVRENLPIWTGAFRSSATRLAGEIADGLIGHPLWGIDWYLGTVQEDIKAGLAIAGKPMESFHQCVYLTVAPNPNVDEALRDAKASVVAFAALEQYQSFYEAQGFGAQTIAIRAALAEGKRQQALNLVSDEMVRAFVLAGDIDMIRSEIDRVWPIANSMVLVPPVWGLSEDRVAFYNQMIERYCYQR